MYKIAAAIAPEIGPLDYAFYCSQHTKALFECSRALDAHAGKNECLTSMIISAKRAGSFAAILEMLLVLSGIKRLSNPSSFVHLVLG
ncbi:hypothetical protein CXF83_07845 [Shewanella sp. Choline-02u-19]|nr:hypothetical protein CXF82_05215 [Shewanella sp. GutDb-MelDb]PKH54886.1 hypothetical protein CXF84_18825 [Shewanella sp. Bg11-22]PKI26658.1 hypothetical protein CXF83_07845 [Shewanella sp. Choline-02u-19]